MIKVGVVGALGKMGKEVVKAVCNAEDMQLVCAVDVAGVGTDIGIASFSKEIGVLVEPDLKNALQTKKPDVVIDFTQPSTIYEHVCIFMQEKVKSVIGTTGLNEEQISNLKQMSKDNKVACLIAPNFSTGAVLLMMFAKQAAKYFDNAEIIELHHNQKKDAPSGTAVKTAQLMAEANDDFTKNNCPEKETIAGARGANSYNNIHIHSVRMPGYIASQEVLLGASGQILTLRHDSMNRECYMKGVILAINHVHEHSDFVYGLENIMQ